MASKAPPEAQIIIRCEKHPPRAQASPYVAAVNAAGDGIAVRCRCHEPGLIWFTDVSWRLYLDGNRDFRPRTWAVTLRTGENIVIRPKTNQKT
jgi:hypothetical protein